MNQEEVTASLQKKKKFNLSVYEDHYSFLNQKLIYFIIILNQLSKINTMNKVDTNIRISLIRNYNKLVKKKTTLGPLTFFTFCIHVQSYPFADTLQGGLTSPRPQRPTTRYSFLSVLPFQKLSQPTNMTEAKHNHNGSLKGMETT